MTTVPIDSIRVATLSSASAPSVLLPVDKHGEQMLVLEEDGDKYAIFLQESRFPFESMKCSLAGSVQGVIYENIRFEVDPSSAFDAQGSHVPTGALIASQGSFWIAATEREDRGFPRSRLFRIRGDDELPPAKEPRSAFYKWRAVIGPDDDAREIVAVEVTPSFAPKG